MLTPKKSYTFDEIKLKLVNYCVYQDRCHYEVEAKMREFNLIQEAKDEILLYLMRENFLNEERYTRSYIRGKFYIKHWGRNKIRMSLKQKGISTKMMDSCFDEIDSGDYSKELEKQFENYYSKISGTPDYQKKMKTIKYLLSRGYEYEEIQNISII